MEEPLFGNSGLPKLEPQFQLQLMIIINHTNIIKPLFQRRRLGLGQLVKSFGVFPVSVAPPVVGQRPVIACSLQYAEVH